MEAMTECCEIKLIKLSLEQLKKLTGFGGRDLFFSGYAESFEEHGGAVIALLQPYGNCEEVKCLKTEYDKVLLQAQVFDQLSKHSFSSASDKGDTKSALHRIIDHFRYHSKDIVSKIENRKLTPKMPAETEKETKTTRKKPKLYKCHMRAWESYEWICNQAPDLLPKEGKRFTLEMYKYVKEHCPSYHDEDGNPLVMPGYESWKRYIRAVEYFKNGPKNTPRTGREQPKTGVKPNEIQNLSEITSKFDAE